MVHRVDQYARAVTTGKQVAGPQVRLACARHLRDRREAAAKGWVFDKAAADHAIQFIEQFCALPDTLDEHGQPSRFVLLPWQAFVVGSLFGWKLTSGRRRFRTGFILTGKGSGKTPLLAAIGLYGLVADGQQAPGIFAVATTRDQAMVMFRDAVRMVDASPALLARVDRAGIMRPHALTYQMGSFRPFSREQGAKSGVRVHMGLLDEIHEMSTPEVLNLLRAGTKGNLDALLIEITNSGFDRTSVCFQHAEHSRRIVEGTVEDDRWFSYVCALDEADDPLQDESCWIKTNPSLGTTIQVEYLRDQVAAARNLPSEANAVLRLNFCVWTTQETRAIDMPQWHAAPASPPESALVGVPCYGGLDLGQSDDFSAWVRIWPLADGTVVVKTRCWIPEAALQRYPNRPYDQWRRAGLLEVTEGDVVDYDVIEQAVRDDCHHDGVRQVAYDKRFAEQLAQHLIGAGIDMVDQPQGFQLNESVKRTLELIAAMKLAHGHHAVLSWMASNYVVRHGTRGDVRPDKEKAAEKIDGMVALNMALAVWLRQPVAAEPQYQMVIL